MIEKEIKILDINKKKLKKKIKKEGAKITFDGIIHDTYFDYHKIDKKKKYKKASVSLENNGRLFRLRKKGNLTYFTIKNKVKDSNIKVAHEKELPVTCHKRFKRVLKKYGLTKTREKKKQRLSFERKGIEFDIDTYKGIPTLLEIEGKSEKQITKWVNRLGLKKNKKKKFGSRRLFDYYGVKYKMK